MEIAVVIIGLLLLFSAIRFAFKSVGKIFSFLIGLVMKLVMIVIFIIVAVSVMNHYQIGPWGDKLQDFKMPNFLQKQSLESDK